MVPACLRSRIRLTPGLVRDLHARPQDKRGILLQIRYAPHVAHVARWQAETTPSAPHGCDARPAPINRPAGRLSRTVFA